MSSTLARAKALIASLRELTTRAQPWSDRVARMGFVAKGLVYVVVGGLAVAAAGGLRGQVTDVVGALKDVATTALGRTLIGVVALGLIGHALFRAVLAVIGEPYGERTPLRRLGRRIANGAAAIGYIGLGATALALSAGWKSAAPTDDDAVAQHWSARVLHAPLGRPALIGVAVALTVAAVVQAVRAAWPRSVYRRLHVEKMSAGEHTLVAVVGRLAFLSRATILGAIAYFLWKGAILRAPGDVRGAGGALHAFWEAPYGSVLLAVVAGGLVAVGAFALLEARWRRFFDH